MLKWSVTSHVALGETSETSGGIEEREEELDRKFNGEVNKEKEQEQDLVKEKEQTEEQEETVAELPAFRRRNYLVGHNSTYHTTW